MSTDWLDGTWGPDDDEPEPHKPSAATRKTQHMRAAARKFGRSFRLGFVLPSARRFEPRSTAWERRALALLACLAGANALAAALALRSGEAVLILLWFATAAIPAVLLAAVLVRSAQVRRAGPKWEQTRLTNEQQAELEAMERQFG